MDSKTGRLKLVVFDMAGTTVDDVIDGAPLVLKSYDDAFRRYGIIIPIAVLNDQRGRDKRTVIEEFGGSQAAEIYEVFVDALLQNVERIREIAGTGEVFAYLHERGVYVAVGSGFPLSVSRAIVSQLRWEERELIDYWTCSEAVGKSRPDPAMIHAAMKRLQVSDPLSVMKVDDTAKGVEEGVNAGVVTLGVLTGTQSKEKLQAAKATDILESVKDLPAYVKTKGLV
jgi:phosphoglycolate phosphatase